MARRRGSTFQPSWIFDEVCKQYRKACEEYSEERVEVKLKAAYNTIIT